jgi:tRNA U34 5-methylaminomethyl-2-thiouridine-forming methyltransferase MnmC
MSWHVTDDGSLSWQDAQLDELCHNRAGAYTEAMTHYVQPFLLSRHNPAGPFNMLDACFGLGYNTWAMVQQVWQYHPGLPLTVTAVEIDPQMWQNALTVLQQPCFDTLKRILDVSEHKIYYQTQGSDSAKEVPVPLGQWLSVLTKGLLTWQQWQWQVSGGMGQFTLSGHCADLLTVRLHNQLDVICHDAFTWRKVPHLWGEALFNQYYQALYPQGVLLTYSRAQPVRARLVNAGFTVDDTPGLGGKKGGTIAIKGLHPNNHDASH